MGAHLTFGKTMKPTYLLLALIVLISVGCSRKRGKLLFSRTSPDQSKKVEIRWHPERDFEYGSDVIFVEITDVSDPANFVAREFFPKGVSSTQYHSLLKDNLSISIDWGKEAFGVRVIETDSKSILLQNP